MGSQCSAFVEFPKADMHPEYYTYAVPRRRAKAARLGYDPHRCLRSGVVMLDGELYCRIHAGRILLKEEFS